MRLINLIFAHRGRLKVIVTAGAAVSVFLYVALLSANAGRSLKGGAHELAGVSLLVDEGSSHATDDLKEEQRDLRQSATSVQDVYDTLKKSFATVEIVKVKDIDVNDDPEAYFLSILAINSTLYASYRTTLSSWNTKVVQVSDQFEILTQTAKYIPNTEDARVIEVNGVGWLIDNHVLQPRAMTTLDGLRRVVLNTSELGPEFDRGKNWSPFVYKSRLFFVYSLLPLRVLECDMPSGALRWAYGDQEKTSSIGIPKNLHEMLTRGGTNGVVHDGHVYGVGRKTVYETVVCSGAQHENVAQHYPLLWRFPTSIIDSETLLTDQDSYSNSIEFREIAHPYNHGVNDPASLFVHASELHLTVSSCSCACLPEFRSGNEWQNNSVFKVRLRE